MRKFFYLKGKQFDEEMKKLGGVWEREKNRWRFDESQKKEVLDHIENLQSSEESSCDSDKEENVLANIPKREKISRKKLKRAESFDSLAGSEEDEEKILPEEND